MIGEIEYQNLLMLIWLAIAVCMISLFGIVYLVVSSQKENYTIEKNIRGFLEDLRD